MSLENSISGKSPKEVINIGLADIVRFLFKYYLILILVPICFGVISYGLSYLIPKMYKATTTLLPEYNMSSSAFSYAMAVTSANQGAENLVPDLYPTVLQSSPFGVYLLQQPVIDQNKKTFITFNEYLHGRNSEKIITINKEILKTTGSEIFNLSSIEQQKIEEAGQMVKVIIDKKNSIISIESEMKDPVVAAVLVEAGKKYLINYVEEYRTNKVLRQIDYLTKELRNSKKRRENAEYSLQNYRDRNRNPFLNTARIEEQRLISDYAVAQSVNDQLIQRLEQAKIKLKEEKPVFKVLEPTKVPTNASGPRRLIITIITCLVTFVFLLLYLFFIKEKYHRYFLSSILV